MKGTDIADEQSIEIFFRVRTAMRDLAVYGESADKSALCLMGSPFVEGSLTTYPREREREKIGGVLEGEGTFYPWNSA